MIKIEVNNEKLLDELILVVKLFYSDDEIEQKDKENLCQNLSIEKKN